MSTDPKEPGFIAAIRAAKAEVKRLKIQSPYLFFDYIELLDARRNLERAKLRLEQAEQDWKTR